MDIPVPHPPKRPVLLRAAGGLGLAAPSNPEGAPAILIVAFGGDSPAAREVYAHLEAQVRAAHPDREVRWAWTARTLVAKLRQRGEVAATLDETLQGLSGQGGAAVLSLHLVPGEKHREILAADPRGLHLAYGQPLLASPGDIQPVAADLLADLPADRPVLVVAHGNGREARFNAELRGLGAALKAVRPDLHLTLLEGDDDPAGLEALRVRARALGKVHVVPFLLIAGDHVRNDILGDEDSLKSSLGVADFTCGPELGRRPWVVRRFLARLDEALAELERA